MKKVSILGCGWVGQALKVTLEDAYEVLCLSRDMETNNKEKMYSCDVLVIAIPPRGNYIEVLAQSLKRLSANTQVILLSSISYYDEKPLVVEAECLVRKMQKDAVILRLGGLMGYDRIAGKYTAGKVLQSDSRTNYIHRDDVLGIIKTIIDKNVRNEVFDVVAPIQSTKKKIFTQNAKKYLFYETKFLQGETIEKVLSAKSVSEVLDYTFKREDVHTFWD